MFHVQLRSHREVARAFNLTAEQVTASFLEPLRSGRRFEYGGKEWEPAETRIVVLEGRPLRTDELMLGRGWPSAERIGVDVTARLLQADGGVAPAAGAGAGGTLLERLKDRVLGRVMAGPMEVREIVLITSELMPAALVSDRVGLAEKAVWELLHAGVLELQIDGMAVSPDGWREVLLAAGTWTGLDLPVRLARPGSR